jgi:hypothetical protein
MGACTTFLSFFRRSCGWIFQHLLIQWPLILQWVQ